MTSNSKINTFNVHHKTLELADYIAPNKADAYDIYIEDIDDIDYLLTCCNEINSLCAYIYDLSHDLFKDRAASDWAHEEIKVFLKKLNQDELNVVLKHVRNWMDGPLDEDDYNNYRGYYPYSGYQYAFYLFQDEGSKELEQHVYFDVHQVAEALNIYIVEGDHPGSSYLGAELGISVEEANNISKKEGFPLRFVKIN